MDCLIIERRLLEGQSNSVAFPTTAARQVLDYLKTVYLEHEPLLAFAADEFMNKFCDVRYVVCKIVLALLKETSADMEFAFALLSRMQGLRSDEKLDGFLLLSDSERKGISDQAAILERHEEPKASLLSEAGEEITPDVELDVSLNELLDCKAHRQVFSDCWLALLRRPLSPELHRRVLLHADSDFLSQLNSPIQLIDFLGDSYSMGGVCSILSLNALFILISDYNL